MKPCKAWALVDADTGELQVVYPSRKAVDAIRGLGERIVQVEVREVPKKAKVKRA